MKSLKSGGKVILSFDENNLITKDDRYTIEGIDYFFVQLDAPEIVEYIEPVIVPVIEVPQTVTNRQGTQQLIYEDLLDSVYAVINSIVDLKQRRMMIVWLEQSQVFERNRPEIPMVLTALGKDSAFIDQLFINAAKR
jgi:hypothetical protein